MSIRFDSRATSYPSAYSLTSYPRRRITVHDATWQSGERNVAVPGPSPTSGAVKVIVDVA